MQLIAKINRQRQCGHDIRYKLRAEKKDNQLMGRSEDCFSNRQVRSTVARDHNDWSDADASDEPSASEIHRKCSASAATRSSGGGKKKV